MSFLKKILGIENQDFPETRVVGNITCFPQEYTLVLEAAESKQTAKGADKSIEMTFPTYLVSLKASQSQMNTFIDKHGIDKKLLRPDGTLPMTTISGEGLQMPDDVAFTS